MRAGVHTSPNTWVSCGPVGCLDVAAVLLAGVVTVLAWISGAGWTIAARATGSAVHIANAVTTTPYMAALVLLPISLAGVAVQNAVRRRRRLPAHRRG